MALTAAQKNRAVRQDELRAKLAAGGHLENVIEYANKIAELDNDLDAFEIQRLKHASDIKLKLINKYLPDLKATEVTGEAGSAVVLQQIRRVIVDA